MIESTCFHVLEKCRPNRRDNVVYVEALCLMTQGIPKISLSHFRKIPAEHKD
jgi:hypothetical protein